MACAHDHSSTLCTVTTIDVSIVFDRPALAVWDFITDLRTESQWWQGVHRSERLSGDGQVGTRYFLHASLVGIPADADVFVTAFEPPRRFAIKASGRLAYRCEYLLDPVPEGTRLALHIDIDRLPQWLGPLLQVVLYHNLRRLRRILAN